MDENNSKIIWNSSTVEFISKGYSVIISIVNWFEVLIEQKFYHISLPAQNWLLNKLILKANDTLNLELDLKVELKVDLNNWKKESANWSISETYSYIYIFLCWFGALNGL